MLKRVVALNAPFSGTSYAFYSPFKSIRMFHPSSSIVSSLKLYEIVNNHIVSIYGDFDPHIPEGSFLKGAKNVQLDTKGHFRVISNKDVHTALLEYVEYLSREDVIDNRP